MRNSSFLFFSFLPFCCAGNDPVMYTHIQRMCIYAALIAVSFKFCFLCLFTWRSSLRAKICIFSKGTSLEIPRN